MKYQCYIARTEIDPVSGLIFGEVVGLRDMITFQGTSVTEAVRAFQESVDLYLRTCAEQGLDPERPYSGSIAVRTKPGVHRALVALAKARGQSLNELVDQVLTRTVRRAGLESSASSGAVRDRRSGSTSASQAQERPGTERGDKAPPPVAARPGDAASPIARTRQRGAKPGQKPGAKRR